ncbi:GDNF family receptor alpha-4-like isoform X1 [Petromyzon marinus]|uniref:GDNF family receptor alpha-4-like isoform X1 n=1 Tax=Petromyzon marinus TaxID=7757 RepID=UPI003F72DF93
MDFICAIAIVVLGATLPLADSYFAASGSAATAWRASGGGGGGGVGVGAAAVKTAAGALPALRGASHAAASAVHTTPRVDCVKGNELCTADLKCSSTLRTLRQCLAGSGEMLLGPDARNECVSAAEALQAGPLSDCRCRRGMKKEKHCLRIYWSIHQGFVQGDHIYGSSPYEPVTYRLQALAAGPPAVPTSGNACLAAAKACNLEEACSRFKNEYVKTCTPKGDVCRRRECHQALRQFFERVPANSTHGMLFCPCAEFACTERRRKTIVPACSYEEPERANCLSLNNKCKSNYICRSRLADFIINCSPSKKSISGCYNENYASCLLSYTGLIGTVMTPNYVDTQSAAAVSPWCSCGSSGNDREECDRLLKLFTDNPCLRNAMQAFSNGSEVWAQRGMAAATASVLSPPELPRGRDPPQVQGKPYVAAVDSDESADDADSIFATVGNSMVRGGESRESAGSQGSRGSADQKQQSQSAQATSPQGGSAPQGPRGSPPHLLLLLLPLLLTSSPLLPCA